MDFVKARKSQAKARVALIGPTGAGKTYTALVMATGMAKEMGKDGSVVVIDTEHNSAAKYSDMFDFMVPSENLPDHSPASYVKAIEACEKAGFAVIVIDSLSHAWVGKGGALEMKDRFAAQSKAANSFQAWSKVTPEHNALMEKLISSPAHIIATMRSKMSYVQDQDDRGRTRIRKLGMAPVQRDGVEYEFDLIGDISREHTMTIDKTRWSEIDQFHGVVDEEFGRKLVRWLSDGVESVPVKKPDYKTQLREYLKANSDFNFAAFVVDKVVPTLAIPSDPSNWSALDFEAVVSMLPVEGKKKKAKIAVN